MSLVADCETDSTIEIPDGYRLRGHGRTITARDPAGGAFYGAILRAAGASARVESVVLVASELAPVCHESDDAGKLRGILFDGVSGSISGTRILDLAQREGGCLEGWGIEVRNTSSQTARVAITGNTIVGYQRGGLVIRGNSDVSVSLNHIEGLGATDRFAQNGIQVSDGASALIWWNTIVSNRFAPMTASSSGVLLYAAGPNNRVLLNRIDGNDVGVFIRNTPESEVRYNRIVDSTFVGIYDPSGASVIEPNTCQSASGESLACDGLE